jgi:outer membrane protein assembly factor BamC
MRRRLPLALAAALWFGGCSTEVIEGKHVDYKSAATLPSLEVPPDLTSPARDRRFAIPEAGTSSATLSAYEAERTQGPSGARTGVLPKPERARIERAGALRWLVVDEPAEKLWPAVRSFWRDNGLTVALEVPEAGIMETDWAENRALIPATITGRLFSQAMPELDKYRTRFERGADGKSTEITVSHRGLRSYYVDDARVELGWQPRDSDPALEAEFLARLLARLGVPPEKAGAAVAGAGAAQERVRVKTGAQGVESLEVLEPFDRAWRRVGLALDRLGFTVEDRDRQKGLYYVRYADPEAGLEKKEESLFSRLAFWRSSEEVKKGKAQRYRIEVRQSGEASQVKVLDQAGAPAASKTAQRILGILHEQIK